MSDIGTHKQVVDSERFSIGFDSTFNSKPKKPGKTVYVYRDGRLVPKEPWSCYPQFPPIPS